MALYALLDDFVDVDVQELFPHAEKHPRTLFADALEPPLVKPVEANVRRRGERVNSRVNVNMKSELFF